MTPTTPSSQKPYRDLTPEELAEAIEANKVIFHQHFDLTFLKSLNEEIVQQLNHYFRPQLIGFEDMPDRHDTEHPIIYACNHSGMAFPWDAIIFGSSLMKKHEYQIHKLFRPLAAPMLSASNLMNPFLLTDLWKRVGAIDATGLNFETMMHYPDANLLIYPEGVPGIGKGFNRRYEMQPFSTSMIRMAIKYRTDIIGLSCVNGEFINPYAYSSQRINKLINKVGVPFLPLSPILLLLVLQPWIFYLGFPARLTYIMGNRYRPYELVGDKAWEEVSMEEIRQVRDHIQADMQAELDQQVQEHGRKPYRWGELFRNLAKHWRDLPYWLPVGWPALFTEFDRRYQKESTPPKGIIRGWFKFWRILFRNPIIFAYFIPVLGWLPILWKGLRGRRVVQPWEGSKNPPDTEHDLYPEEVRMDSQSPR
ncbi:MAG: hypothetical protein AAF399_18860 [Bacteroidota bacterium]